jgi:hypothetical protein
VVRDVYEILRQKEMDCARLQKEIEALRLVIPLLTDEERIPQPEGQEQENVSPDKTGTDGSFFLIRTYGVELLEAWPRTREVILATYDRSGSAR